MADKKPIRILQVIGCLGVGGAERQLLEMCRRLDRSRFDVPVLYYAHTPDALDQEYRNAGIRVEFLDKFAVPAWTFFQQLRAAIRRERPDIVHTWLYSANFWGRWAAASVGIDRLVSSVRAEVTSFHMLQYATEKLLNRRTVSLANSRAVRRSLARRSGVPESRTRVIYNAVELPECDRAEARRSIRLALGIDDSEQLVLMVGRQTPEKNYPMFIRAAAHICRKRDDVTFVGLGRAMMQEQLQRLIDAEHSGDSVRLIDQREDVTRFLAAADIFCLTSDTEGFPNVVLEAMAAGLPVVCTRFSAADEIIENEMLGTLVPCGDDEALAAVVVSLLDDRQKRIAMGEAARAWAKDRFSYDRLLAKMERLYAQIYTSGVAATVRSS